MTIKSGAVLTVSAINPTSIVIVPGPAVPPGHAYTYCSAPS